MTFRFIALYLFLCLSFFACQNEELAKEEVAQDDCNLYKRNLERLEKQMIEAERNADRLEEVMYQLTQTYILIDQKIRLIQKFKTDGSQEKLLKRTASEINGFFRDSQALLDSTELTIKQSSIPQSSLIPIIETVRSYLTYQEKLFIEVYGNIQSIKKQVSQLQKTIVSKQSEMLKREKESLNLIKQKEKDARKIYYLVGGKSELERAKAIKKKGGFLGIGSTIQLSDKLDEMFFQTADFNLIKEIALGNTKKVNLITVHPKGSFLILDTPGERFLKVTNPEKFWSASKFLIVEVD
jgi:hypothetical protein